MKTIYTSKRTGAEFTDLTTLDNGKFQLTSTKDSTNVITISESTLKRWYKKSIEVDFTDVTEPEQKVEQAAEPAVKESKPAKKATGKGKKHGPRAKTYEEQKWGLNHTRMHSNTFCELFGVNELEYDNVKHVVYIQVDGVIAKRRGWKNELTGCMWFRFKNAEYELTDVDYDAGIEFDANGAA